MLCTRAGSRYAALVRRCVDASLSLEQLVGELLAQRVADPEGTPAAAAAEGALVLTAPTSLPASVRTYLAEHDPAEIVVKGRHDPTALPRLVPIAEAMLALVLADHWLRQRLARAE